LNSTRMMILDFRLAIDDLQAAANHCHEITSSAFVPVFLSEAGPGTLCDRASLPKDQAITPI